MNDRMPTKAEWREIVKAIGPSGVQRAEILAFWISEHRAMDARLQDCVQEYGLGLGGENVAELVIAEVAKLRGGPRTPGRDAHGGFTTLDCVGTGGCKATTEVRKTV